MATGDQCELNWLNPGDPAAFGEAKQCKQGSVPDYYVSRVIILRLEVHPVFLY